MKNKIIKAASVITALMLASCNTYTLLPSVTYAAEQSAQSEAFVTIPEGTFASNGMLTITYDPEKIKVTGTTSGDMLKGVMNSANIREGKITFGFASIKPVDISGNILKITYEGNEGTSPFTMNVNELITLDDKGNELSVDTSGIYVKTDIPHEAEFDLSYSSSGSNITATLGFPEGTKVTNGVITVNYDKNKLKFLDGAPEKALENGMAEFHETQDGQIKIVFIDTTEINGGKALSLNFKALAESSDISVYADEFFFTDKDGKSKSIPVKPAYCSVKADKTVTAAKLSIFPSEPDDPENPTSKVAVTANIPAGTGVTNGVLTLSYDPEVISVSDITPGGSLENAMTAINEISEGTVKIVFISSDPINDEGWISFECTGKKDGTAAVSINADEFFATSIDGIADPIPVENAEVMFNISSFKETQLKYDINGDGDVSAPDLIVMSACIFSPDSVKPEVLKRADLNKNGIVNVFDMIRLKKYLLSYLG